MNISNQIIEMWKIWSPENSFVSPFQVSNWYWDKHLHCNGLHPIFPDGEINDLAAVISGSKPAALLHMGKNGELPSFRVKFCKEIALNIVEIATNNNVFMQRNHNETELICSKNKETIKKIQEADLVGNGIELGRLLGYPEQSIIDFFNNKPINPFNIVVAEVKEENPSFIVPSSMFDDTHN
jgi:hypothetical protein